MTLSRPDASSGLVPDDASGLVYKGEWVGIKVHA